MKKLLPFVFILLFACNKESIKPESSQNGIVNYTIKGDSIQIVDSSSSSVAKWIYLTSPSKGYALQAYHAKESGEVSYMISFYIKTDKIETGQSYSNVTGTILLDSTDYASTENLEGTSIKIFISEQKDQTLTGTFIATLKNLNTNAFVEISGSFDNVRLTE